MAHRNMTIQHTLEYTPGKPLKTGLQLTGFVCCALRCSLPLSLKRVMERHRKQGGEKVSNGWALEESKAYSWVKAIITQAFTSVTVFSLDTLEYCWVSQINQKLFI